MSSMPVVCMIMFWRMLEICKHLYKTTSASIALFVHPSHSPSFARQYCSAYFGPFLSPCTSSPYLKTLVCSKCGQAGALNFACLLIASSHCLLNNYITTTPFPLSFPPTPSFFSPSPLLPLHILSPRSTPPHPLSSSHKYFKLV